MKVIWRENLFQFSLIGVKTKVRSHLYKIPKGPEFLLYATVAEVETIPGLSYLTISFFQFQQQLV